MIQTQDLPVVPLQENVESGRTAFDALRGLALDDAISNIANGIVGFCFRLFIALLVFYAGKFIIKKLYSLVNSILAKRKVEASLTTFVLSLTRIVLFFLLIIIVVGILGIETSSFIALFASAGVAVGMALSGTLQNFAGGVLILLLKPYKVGDFIEAQGFTGTVKEIQIFHTVVNTADNKSIIIPNGGLSTGSINNYSKESYRRVDWTIGLSYGDNASAAKDVMTSMLLEDPDVEKGELPDGRDAKPFVALSNLGDSSVDFTVRAWTKSSSYWPLYFRMNERFYKELPEKGFSFPFPQMDVHVVK